MNLINSNPFRILGLPITASEREITKQINSLITFAEFGKTKSFDSDFPFLSSVKRTPQNIEEAKKQIEQSESKFLYSLFWFWNNNSVDELVLEVLKEGNTSKAIEIWEKSVFADKNKVYLAIILVENLIRHSNGWSEQKNEDHSLTKKQEEYIIERKKETGTSTPSVQADFILEGNWSIDCDTEWISGIDNNGYGIIFGKENGNYYLFEISGNGYYRFGKTINWIYNNLIPWKQSDSSKKRSTNNIQIKKISDVLCFFVNGAFLNTWIAEPFFGKNFGFIVSQNQKISFRNFKFCELVEDEIYGEGINITSKNYSCLKNLSTLYLSLADNNGSLQVDSFKKGIALAKSFFASARIWNYSTQIAGERFVYNPEKALHFYIDDIINSLKNYIEKSSGISTSQLISAFSTFPLEAKQFVENRFVSKQIQNINKEIEISNVSRKRSAENAVDIGKTLVINTKEDIQYLMEVLGKNDFKYQIIADKLSSEIVQCGIDAFNSCKDENGEIDFSRAIISEENYLHEYEFAKNVAVTERAIEKAKVNLNSCVKWIREKENYFCWFCGNNPPLEDSEYEITIYKETFRGYYPNRSVQYSYVPLKIRRCEHCKGTHTTGTIIFSLFLIVFSVIGILIGFNASENTFIGIILGSIIGWLLGSFFQNQYISNTGIRDTRKRTLKRHPSIIQKFKEGWQFKKPTA